jgi:hypothetical protein
MRSVLRAVTIGNVAQFKELMEMNEEFGYDYRTLFKNYNVFPKLNHRKKDFQCFTWPVRMEE